MRATLSCFILVLMLLATGCYRGTVPGGIGAAARDFTVQDDEHKITLAQFRGQVVVLNFWASWCPPCIAETPSLESMQQRLKAKGVVVVGISADEDELAYHRFLKQYAIDFATVRQPSAATQHLYGTVQIPETYIIDRNGRLRRKFVNAVDWNSPEILQYLSSL